MSVSPISNEQEWKGIVADKEVRACLRRVSLTVLSDIDPRRVMAYRQTVEAMERVFKKQEARISDIDSEIGCLVTLLSKLPDSGESHEFRRMMEERRTALLQERGEILNRVEQGPKAVESANRLLKEVEGQVANAEFLRKIIEEADRAEGGVPGVEHEPRGAGGDGAAPDAARNG